MLACSGNRPADAGHACTVIWLHAFVEIAYRCIRTFKYASGAAADVYKWGSVMHGFWCWGIISSFKIGDAGSKAGVMWSQTWGHIVSLRVQEWPWRRIWEKNTFFPHRAAVIEPWRLPKLRKQTERNWEKMVIRHHQIPAWLFSRGRSRSEHIKHFFGALTGPLK